MVEGLLSMGPTPLSYKCRCVMEVVVEEVFSTVEYYPIFFLDYSSFLSNNLSTTENKKEKCFLDPGTFGDGQFWTLFLLCFQDPGTFGGGQFWTPFF